MTKHKAVEQMLFEDVPMNVPFKILKSFYYEDRFKDTLFCKDHAATKDVMIVKTLDNNPFFNIAVKKEFIQLCEVYFLKHYENIYNNACTEVICLKSKLEYYEKIMTDYEKEIKEMKENDK